MTRVFNDCVIITNIATYFRVYSERVAKRSEALWGHNLTRDSRVDGASMTCSGASEDFLRRSFCSPTIGSF